MKIYIKKRHIVFRYKTYKDIWNSFCINSNKLDDDLNAYLYWDSQEFL